MQFRKTVQEKDKELHQQEILIQQWGPLSFSRKIRVYVVIHNMVLKCIDPKKAFQEIEDDEVSLKAENRRLRLVVKLILDSEFPFILAAVL